MPIRPEERHRYPPHWPAIRAGILQRAGHQCEHPGCGARNYAFGLWHLVGGEWRWAEIHDGQPPARTYAEARQRAAEVHWGRSEEGQKPVVIVLTIAHLDHVPEHCEPDNLRALCQRHHLAHDVHHHRQTRARTRHARAGTLDMFEAALQVSP